MNDKEKAYVLKEANDVTADLIDKDYAEGFLSFPGMPLPTLYDEAKDVTTSIFAYVKDYFEKEVREGRMQKNKLPYNVYHTTMLWSALAGIGAMELWRLKGKKILDRGVVYYLTKERGFFSMDEYVLDLVTDGFESEEARKLKERLEQHIQLLIHTLFVTLPEAGVDNKTYFQQFFNYCMALYDYGLVVQDDRADTREKEDVTDEELCGKGWLLIAGQQIDEGLTIMHELDEDSFDEGSVALAMFTTDHEERKRVLDKPATMGNAEAIWQYSCYLPHSFAADANDEKDNKWLNYCVIAAENDCVEAMNELGNVFHRQKNYPESMYWYAMAYANGKENGQTSMEGIAKEWMLAGAPRDYIKGTGRFDESRHKCAIWYLELYAGLTPTTNVNDIFALALSGTAIAGYLAGEYFESNNNLEMAFQAYKAIAFEDDPHGLKCCADMLFTGRGTELNKEAAFEHYEEAARCGDRESMFVMGEISRTKGNKNLAAYWYGMAYARGYEPAEVRLVQLAMDIDE